MILALFLFSTWSFNYGEVSVKTVAIAATVFALLQVVKKFTNLSFLKGNWSIAANVFLNVVGVLATTAPSQLLATTTLVNLATAIFLASGFHGVVTTVAPATKGSAEATPPVVPPAEVDTPVTPPASPKQ